MVLWKVVPINIKQLFWHHISTRDLGVRITDHNQNVPRSVLTFVSYPYSSPWLLCATLNSVYLRNTQSTKRLEYLNIVQKELINNYGVDKIIEKEEGMKRKQKTETENDADLNIRRNRKRVREGVRQAAHGSWRRKQAASR